MKWFITLLLLLLTPSTTVALSRHTDDIRPGDSIPKFSVKSNRGKTISTSSLSGKPAVIVFFHTKCLDCRRELPVVQTLYEEYQSDYEFLCISRGEDTSDIQPFWQEYKLTLPYSAQKDKEIFHLFAQKTIPRIYIIDSHGVVVRVFKEKVRKRRLSKALSKNRKILK